MSKRDLSLHLLQTFCFKILQALPKVAYATRVFRLQSVRHHQKLRTHLDRGWIRFYAKQAIYEKGIVNMTREVSATPGWTLEAMQDHQWTMAEATVRIRMLP